MQRPFYPLPEVVGEVPSGMFEDYQAVMQQAERGTGRPLGEIRFANGLSDHEYRLHEALSPLVNLIVERETRRIHTLDISSSFEPLSSQPRYDTDYWHRDGNTFTLLVGYMVAMTTGTEFRVPARFRKKLAESQQVDGPGLDIVEEDGRSLVVQPRPLTVVRFTKQMHRRPTAPGLPVEDPPVRPWLRASLNNWY